jgi:hypothetical protein
MRKGFYPQLVFTNSGNLVGIATGSDATTEHEIGIQPLLCAMTSSSVDEEAVVTQLKGVFSALVKYPNLAESRRITRLPESFQYVETEGKDGQPEAWLGVCNGNITNWGRTELEFPHPHSFSERDMDVAAAYSDRDFGIRVRGKKYVKALRGFHEAMKAGDVMFGGLFFERPKMHLSGLVLVNRKFLGDEDKASLAKAQRDLESKLRLKARDDTRELAQQMYKMTGRDPGYLWVRWADAEEKSISYYLNPGYGIKADYGGPYTRQQLLDWAGANYGYQLTWLPVAA